MGSNRKGAAGEDKAGADVGNNATASEVCALVSHPLANNCIQKHFRDIRFLQKHEEAPSASRGVPSKKGSGQKKVSLNFFCNRYALEISSN